jgi:glycerol-3-phosphate acyltransferase PlsY
MIAGMCWLALTYLLAAVPFGLLITTLYGGDEDIRAEGSGNIGATNVARVYGWRLAVPVILLDVGKGLIPVVFAELLWPGASRWWFGAVALTAFAGHVWSIYLSFNGGKGVATGAGVMLGLAPIPTLFAALSWSVVLFVSGRSSLASLVATGVLVGVIWQVDPTILPLGLLLAVGIFVSHTANIRRLIAGDEAAIVRPVRWGRAGNNQAEDPTLLLERGPAGGAPLAVWRVQPHGDAS